MVHTPARTKWFPMLLSCGLLVGSPFIACAGDGHSVVGPPSGDPSAFTWDLPSGVAPPPVPVDNPMSPAKVELGRRLFYDTRLSGSGRFACASCHPQERAFSDGRAVAVGSTGQSHRRNTLGLSNAGYFATLGWANPDTRSLEAQALIPMFNDAPVELGLKGRESEALVRLRSLVVYRDLFAASFPEETSPVTVHNITRALAAFQRTLIAMNAPMDRFRRGEPGAVTVSARRGEQAFIARGCPQCHFGTFLTRATESGAALADFANTGLYNVGGTGAYPPGNGGLFETTQRPSDMGRMRVPSLRNVALTAPFGHDGSVSSLGDVIENYQRGGRLVATGPDAGDGGASPLLDSRLSRFTLAPGEKADLLAFLLAMTDSSLVTSTRFSNPWR